MKLEKAIEILEHEHQRTWGDGFPEIRDAVNLGIEALKVIKDVRPTDYGAIDDPLPGGTE